VAWSPQEADDIFGNVDDLLAMYEDRRRHRQGEEELEGDELEEEELEEGDEEEAAARREAKVEPLPPHAAPPSCSLHTGLCVWGGGH
jgi:hypothetical protein